MPRKKKDRGLQISFPPKIHQLALDFCRERLAKEESERQNRLKQEKEKKRQHAMRLKTGLPYAQKIFAWAAAFRKSDNGEELIRKAISTHYQGVYFFDDHIIGVDQVSLGISPSGLFIIMSGWKSGGKVQKSAFDLAIAVPSVILKAAWEWIENGRVWECIECRLGYIVEERWVGK